MGPWQSYSQPMRAKWEETVSIPSEFESFWAAGERAQASLDRGRFIEAFAFGDNEGTANALAELVLAGCKRATTSLVWSFEYNRKPRPRPGDLSIVTSWAKEPLCIIETTATEVMPFEKVPEDFARLEGEDDGTLQSWRKNHSEFFARECARIGCIPSPRMPVLCERFRVLFQTSKDRIG